jgi:ferredoxin-like protein FixX
MQKNTVKFWTRLPDYYSAKENVTALLEFDHKKCKKCDICTYICPASCYKAEGNRAVTLITDGCLECGTCRIICTQRNIDWEYPRGGYGIQFKFG